MEYPWAPSNKICKLKLFIFEKYSGIEMTVKLSCANLSRQSFTRIPFLSYLST